jgi:hypothetical protein
MTQILAMQELATEDQADDEMPGSWLSWSYCGNGKTTL